MKRLIAWLFLLCAATSASNCTDPKVPVPATCQNACDVAQKLCGPNMFKPRRGGACVDVCTNAQSNGLDFHVKCLVEAESCADVNACAIEQ